MYSLFEIRKILSVSRPGGERGVNITLSAYSEIKDHSILALVCDNGYLLFRYINLSMCVPVIRQLCWFNCPDKKIKALSFDASGTWLLIVTQDATIYVLPVYSLLESDAKVPAYWKSDNLTEIKLTGKRAPLTSVQWWQTHEGQHIAVIGSEGS